MVAYLVAVAVTPPSAPWALVAQGALAVGLAALALVEWRALAGRLALDLPLAVLAVAYAVAGRGPRVDVLGLSLSRPGLSVGLAVLAKAAIGIVAVSALAASTTAGDTIAGLARLGAPGWFRHLLALSLRQVQVLRADLARVRRAVEVRTGTARCAVAVATGARALGVLFVRSTERADALRLAAELRGGGASAVDHRPPPHGPPRRLASWVVALVPAALAVTASVGLR